MRPCNFEENVVWYTILGTYLFYFMGILYFVPTLVTWGLTLYLCKKLWQQSDSTPADQRIRIPWIIWAWLAAMFVMLVSLVMAHVDFDLGTATLLKSILGWARGWALWALLPLVGCLSIRPQLIYRAICMLGLQSLVIFPVFVVGFLLRLPDPLYTVPWNVFGGPIGAFQISFYTIDPENRLIRIGLFAPWAAAIGYVSSVFFPLSLAETNRWWRSIGIAAAVLMAVISGSRLAVLALPATWLLTQVLSRLSRPSVLIGLSGVSLGAGLTAPQLIDLVQNFIAQFRSFRSSSSDLRATLDNIALQRWPEALWTGHGIVERGPKLVQFMPIGSHNTWVGLLFVKGLVGFLALCLAMATTFGLLIFKAQTIPLARVALHLFLALFLNTFGDSIEVTVYLVWPGLLLLGLAYNASVDQPRKPQLVTALEVAPS
ncbi:hypothetical protein [Synechococcus sp. PCC 6312]|uniref:hypothetical protein n=1 Tax=Synechococcus sp. (strain ATCC 27167 / PCC 6312) TaxID=195253 RepID=UPI00029EEBF9|nr:hypothetical protein [Synechococcus sp. PCC 6312]AFY59927.1 hypothetical protein Syn6312_0708 [Synechococcus sp. PCC 6312]